MFIALHVPPPRSPRSTLPRFPFVSRSERRCHLTNTIREEVDSSEAPAQRNRFPAIVRRPRATRPPHYPSRLNTYRSSGKSTERRWSQRGGARCRGERTPPPPFRPNSTTSEIACTASHRHPHGRGLFGPSSAHPFSLPGLFGRCSLSSWPLSSFTAPLSQGTRIDGVQNLSRFLSAVSSYTATRRPPPPLHTGSGSGFEHVYQALSPRRELF